MAKEFYNDLINYVASSDTDNANTLLMKELGKSLVKSKENFVELLTSSGVAANDSMSDVELIDAVNVWNDDVNVNDAEYSPPSGFIIAPGKLILPLFVNCHTLFVGPASTFIDATLSFIAK
jgi:hypothetical protein